MDTIITDRKILKQISSKTTIEEVRSLDLLHRLRKACESAWTKGCGLAAIQIGITLRYAWFRFEKNHYELFNPEIIAGYGEVEVEEGCLSIPDKITKRKRYYEIKYTNNGKIKRAKDLKAQIIQHEIDHMNGILNDEIEI